MHCFYNENKKKQKKCGYRDDYDNCTHCKKLKYIRERLNRAYYFSPQKDTPWLSTYWKGFLFYQVDKEFENIQKLVLNN